MDPAGAISRQVFSCFFRTSLDLARLPLSVSRNGPCSRTNARPGRLISWRAIVEVWVIVRDDGDDSTSWLGVSALSGCEPQGLVWRHLRVWSSELIVAPLDRWCALPSSALQPGQARSTGRTPELVRGCFADICRIARASCSCWRSALPCRGDARRWRHLQVLRLPRG